MPEMDPRLAAAIESAGRGDHVRDVAAAVNLRTRYLGLDLRNPVVASAGPLSQTPAQVGELADAGVGAVVLYSLFEEQLRSRAEYDELLMVQHRESFAEALDYFPDEADEPDAAAHYLELLEQAAGAVDIPVIASLNGANLGGWVQFARRMADAGAAAIECNIYAVPGDVATDARELEERHLDILAGVKQAVDIPVAVKLSPHFSSVGQLCLRLAETGADGLVLFNRFLQPEIDVATLAVVPGVTLSSPVEARLPRTWIAALRGRVDVSLAATTGVETADDVVAYLLAGADVVMTTSALVRHGAAYARQLIDGLEAWLARGGYASVDQIRGMLAIPADADASAYERSGYVAALTKAKRTYGSLA